jgi:hypothetical protein
MGQKKFWKEFRNDVKRGLARNNEDITHLKSAMATMKEKDRGVAEKIDSINTDFRDHNAAEMVQYASIDGRLRTQARMIWIGFGILLASQFFLSRVPVQG